MYFNSHCLMPPLRIPDVNECWVGILSPAMGRGIDSRNQVWNWIAKLHRLAGRYDNPMPTWFLAPIAGPKLPAQGLNLRKCIDWKKTKLFHFRWNWDEEANLRGIRLEISSPPPTSPPFVYDGGGGQDFVDSIISVKMLSKGIRYGLYRAAPRCRGWRSVGLVCWRSVVACGPIGGWSWKGGGACKNPWRLARGKQFPARFPCMRQGEMYPAGCLRDAWRGKSREQTAAAAPGP